MYVIGLTGNIATGKSTVAGTLGRLGACLIDADKLAHWVMRAGTEVNRRIVGRFGQRVLCADGDIDRARLGQIVFSDPSALGDLEAIVHPPVVAEALARLDRCTAAVAVVEAIKLLESSMAAHCDAVWVVDCPREQQIERLMHMRGLDQAQAELRIDAQPSPQHKLARADIVIDNSHTLEDIWVQVVSAWQAIPSVSVDDSDRICSAMCADKK